MSFKPGKLNFKGDKPKKSKKRKEQHDDDDDDIVVPDHSSDPIPGEGKLTTSGVVVMGTETDFKGAVEPGDQLLVTISDRFRNTETVEQRVVNMVLGKTSLNLVAPFSCDVTSPTSFLILKRAPDIEALKAAKQAERKKQRQLEEEESTVTYKVVKQGSGTWKTWETVTERVGAGTSREDMLRRRESEKADRFCK